MTTKPAAQFLDERCEVLGILGARLVDVHQDDGVVGQEIALGRNRSAEVGLHASGLQRPHQIVGLSGNALDDGDPGRPEEPGYPLGPIVLGPGVELGPHLDRDGQEAGADRGHLDRDLVATGNEVDLDYLFLPIGRRDHDLGRPGNVGSDDSGDRDDVAFAGRRRKDHALDQRVGAAGRRQFHHVHRHPLVGQTPDRRANVAGGGDQIGYQDDSSRAFARHQRRCRLQGAGQVGGGIVGDGPNRARDPGGW